MSLISDVLSNQIFAHAFRSVQPGQMKATDPSKKYFSGPTQQGKTYENQATA
jgi:hypothetical protein